MTTEQPPPSNTQSDAEPCAADRDPLAFPVSISWLLHTALYLTIILALLVLVVLLPSFIPHR
ncbi:MAG: hypothetical protein WCG26_03230 [Chloroflexales bacterium]